MLTSHFRPTGNQVDYMRNAVQAQFSGALTIHHLPHHAATAAHTTPGGQLVTTHSVFHVKELNLDFEVVLDWNAGHQPAPRVRPIIGYVPFDAREHGGTLTACVEAAYDYQRQMAQQPAHAS